MTIVDVEIGGVAAPPNPPPNSALTKPCSNCRQVKTLNEFINKQNLLKLIAKYLSYRNTKVVRTIEIYYIYYI